MDDNRLVLCNFPEPRDWALKNGQDSYCQSGLKIAEEVMEEILTRHPTARTLRDEGNIVQIQDDDFVIVEADNPLAVESIKITSKRPSMIFVVWPENMSEWHADRKNKREPRVWIHPRSNVKNWDTTQRTRVSKRKAKKEEDDEEPVQKKKRGRPRKQVTSEGNDKKQEEEQEEVQDKKQKKKEKKEKKKAKEEPQASTSMVTRSSGRTSRKNYEEFDEEEVEYNDEEEEVEDSEIEETEEAKPEESEDEVHEEAEDVQTKVEANVEDVQDKEEKEDVKAIKSAPAQKMVSEAKIEKEIKEAVSNSVQNQNGDQITTNGNSERPNPSSPAVPVALVPNVAAEDWSRNIYGAVLPPPANNVPPAAPITETPKRPVGRPRKNKDGQSAQNGANELPRELNANAAHQAQAPAAPAVPNQALMHHEQEDQARRAQAERMKFEQLQHHNGFGFGGLPGTSQQQYRGSMGAHQGLGGYTYPGYSHHHQGVPGYFGCGYSNAQTASSSNAPPAAGPSGVAFRPSSNGASTVPETADYGAFAGGMNAHPHGYPGAYHEAYGGVYPGSPNQFSARAGSNQAANGHLGSTTHLAGQPGFNQGANGYAGAPNHLAARPGQGAAAYPGTLPGAHQGYGAYGGYAAGYPEPYHGAGAHYGGYPAANPGAAAYPYPADPVNPDANQGAVNNAGAERWNDGRNL